MLGALAGSVATIGAALATGWAQREGARISARSEHRRERREPRLVAYKEFISAASEFRAQAGLFAYNDFAFDGVDETTADMLYEAARAVKKSALEVALAGPRKVSKEVIKIERLSDQLSTYVLAYMHTMENTSLHGRLRRGYQKSAVTAARRVNRAIGRFVLQAQAALDDDGSAK